MRRAISLLRRRDPALTALHSRDNSHDRDVGGDVCDRQVCRWWFGIRLVANLSSFARTAFLPSAKIPGSFSTKKAQ
jgi:hypothetical protein